ncbi:MAG: YqhA family protein [Chitinophagaceae bacterium]|nr:YqhA family protein [Chitinophagaceae bacterium]
MKNITSLLKIIIAFIAWLVFAAGIVLTIIGVYEFVMVFSHFSEGLHHTTTSLMIIGLLHTIDLFLVAIVFFVMALGFFILFTNPEVIMPVLPEWLRIKNFTELKIILWEAILTTLVVSWLAGLVERKIRGDAIDLQSLIVPGAILIIAMSLFFLKKREK